MEQEGMKTQPEEMISIPKNEYENLCQIAAKPSFWIEALGNPEGTKSVGDFVERIISTGLTLYGDKIQKWQLIYSGFRILLVVGLLAGIVYVSMILTTSGKLDAGAFTFLVGTITGYVLSYLTKTA